MSRSPSVRSVAFFLALVALPACPPANAPLDGATPASDSSPDALPDAAAPLDAHATDGPAEAAAGDAVATVDALADHSDALTTDALVDASAMDAPADVTAADVTAADAPADALADHVDAIACDGAATVCNGACVNLQTDPLHCAACNTVCPAVAGAMATCTGGVCGFACTAGLGNCDGNAGNGCETMLDTTSDCHACGTTCVLANATAVCGATGCAVGGCSAGFRDCDSDPTDGCETDTQSSMTNCGTCHVACGPQAYCNAGHCASICTAGSTSCPPNGCHDLLVDPNACGTCTTVCTATAPNTVPSCTGGTCGTTCSPGYADCDGHAGNGCEVYLATNAAHCGTCANSCATVASSGTCSAGACVTTCGPPSTMCPDGCTNLSTDAINCGACGSACSTMNVTPSCSVATCNGACAPGYRDCNNNKRVDGCEVHTDDNTMNCGNCGTVCSTSHVTASCSGGTCNGTCEAGWLDCNANKQTDGCEVYGAGSANNCGGCGIVCSSSHVTVTSCSGGVCNGTCQGGFADCNANKQTDGCERQVLGNDASNCGSCGFACPTGQSCTAGVCHP